MRNASAHEGKSGRQVVSALIATAFAPADAEVARQQGRRGADQFMPMMQKLQSLINDAEADLVTYIDFPSAHRNELRLTNPLEHVNGKIRLRTDVVGIFPNEDAVKRLFGAILLEQNEEGAVRRWRYMTLGSIAPIGDDATVSLPSMATGPSRPKQATVVALPGPIPRSGTGSVYALPCCVFASNLDFHLF